MEVRRCSVPLVQFLVVIDSVFAVSSSVHEVLLRLQPLEFHDDPLGCSPPKSEVRVPIQREEGLCESRCASSNVSGSLFSSCQWFRYQINWSTSAATSAGCGVSFRPRWRFLRDANQRRVFMSRFPRIEIKVGGTVGHSDSSLRGSRTLDQRSCRLSHD